MAAHGRLGVRFLPNPPRDGFGCEHNRDGSRCIGSGAAGPDRARRMADRAGRLGTTSAVDCAAAIGEEAVRPFQPAGPGAVPGMTAAPQRELIDDCVHCGFCLPHCPTYQNWGEEMDSPRGRIDLMRGLRTGQMAMTPTVAAHFDRCLGCMACVTACPSGVRYDVLIEETRAYVERTYRRGLWARLHQAVIFPIFSSSRRP